MDESTMRDYIADLLEERKQLLAFKNELWEIIGNYQAAEKELTERVRDLSAQLDQCRGVQP